MKSVFNRFYNLSGVVSYNEIIVWNNMCGLGAPLEKLSEYCTELENKLWVVKSESDHRLDYNAEHIEVYLKNPFTGETGWAIEFLSVTSCRKFTKTEAAEAIKSYPDFDCFISLKYESFNN